MIIDSGQRFSPALAGNASINSLTLNGSTLSIAGPATLTVDTTTTDNGGTIILDGALTGELGFGAAGSAPLYALIVVPGSVV